VKEQEWRTAAKRGRAGRKLLKEDSGILGEIRIADGREPSRGPEAAQADFGILRRLPEHSFVKFTTETFKHLHFG